MLNPVARCAEDFNPLWLSVAFGIEVRSLSAERIGTGQTSSTYRLTIDADDFPSTLVAKIAQGEEPARRRVATAHRNKLGFYTRLARTVDVRTPACWCGAVSDDGQSSPLSLSTSPHACPAGKSTDVPPIRWLTPWERWPRSTPAVGTTTHFRTSTFSSRSRESEPSFWVVSVLPLLSSSFPATDPVWMTTT